MLFSNLRRLRRFKKELSVLIGAPLVITGICGALGLAALIYLKKKADAQARMDDMQGAGIRRSGYKRGASYYDDEVFTVDDCIVSDTEDKETKNRSRKTAKKTGTAKKRRPEEGKKRSGGSAGTGQIWIASSVSKVFHSPDCSSAKRISATNRIELKGSAASLLKKGYKACRACTGK